MTTDTFASITTSLRFTADTPLDDHDRAVLFGRYLGDRLPPRNYYDLLNARTPRQIAELVAHHLGRYRVIGHDGGVAIAQEDFPGRDYRIGSDAHTDSLVAEILRYLNDHRPTGPSATGIQCYGPTEALVTLMERIPEHNAAPLRDYLASGSEDPLTSAR